MVRVHRKWSVIKSNVLTNTWTDGHVQQCIYITGNICFVRIYYQDFLRWKGWWARVRFWISHKASDHCLWCSVTVCTPTPLLKQSRFSSLRRYRTAWLSITSTNSDGGSSLSSIWLFSSTTNHSSNVIVLQQTEPKLSAYTCTAIGRLNTEGNGHIHTY